MAEAQLQQFLEKVRQLNAFVALSEADPGFRQRLCNCASHQEVVELASRCGFDIARRWGEPPAGSAQPGLSEAPGGPPGQSLDATSVEAGALGLPDQGSPAVPGGGSGKGLNLLSGPCPPLGQERIVVVLASPHLRLELIESCQFANPAGFWYDQRDWEWVMVLQGEAVLRFADEDQARRLRAGDSLLITPGRRHRVEATDPAPGTRWLALFWSESD